MSTRRVAHCATRKSFSQCYTPCPLQFSNLVLPQWDQDSIKPRIAFATRPQSTQGWISLVNFPQRILTACLTSTTIVLVHPSWQQCTPLDPSALLSLLQQ